MMGVWYCVTRFCAYACSWRLQRGSYHAVHSKVVVLRLQLYGMLMVPSDLRVAGQEKPLVVHDPIEHLHAEWVEKKHLFLQKAHQVKKFSITCLLIATAVRGTVDC